VVWHGPEWIYFHPDCAVEFVIRLMRDVHEVECKYGELTRRESRKPYTGAEKEHFDRQEKTVIYGDSCGRDSGGGYLRDWSKL
jgi:hypothetical protein